MLKIWLIKIRNLKRQKQPMNLNILEIQGYFQEVEMLVFVLMEYSYHQKEKKAKVSI